jgi:hypothetical protein
VLQQPPSTGQRPRVSPPARQMGGKDDRDYLLLGATASRAQAFVAPGRHSLPGAAAAACLPTCEANITRTAATIRAGYRRQVSAWLLQAERMPQPATCCSSNRAPGSGRTSAHLQAQVQEGDVVCCKTAATCW